jgi:hypothetical protein
MNKINKLIIFTLGISLLIPNLFVIAQEEVPEISLSAEGVKSGELADCFDVYKFQSIGITVGVDKSVYKTNEMVEIGGNMVNNNPYPIIDSTLRARILRNHPNPVDRRARYITVDDLIIKENINLKPSERIDFNYEYFIQGNAPSGEYIIQYYVYNQDRFNLAGLSFTEDVIGNMTTFNVEGGGQHIYLDKANITVDGKEHDTRGFMLQVAKDETIPVKIPLINPEKEAKEIEISYKLYKWDEVLQSNLINANIQQVTVPANGKVDLEYKVDTKTEPVYYLVIEAKSLGVTETSTVNNKTMAHIRFAVEGNNKSRINWVGLNKYPVQKGDEVQVMTCVHNTAYATDQGPIKVKSIVKDSKGKELAKIEYEGIMVSAISGLANNFKADKNLNKITIETSLYNVNNEIVDSLITTYDCNELSPESCVKEKEILENSQTAIISVISIIIVCLLSFIGVKRYNKYKQLKQ